MTAVERFIDDPAFDGSVHAVREHYRHVRTVYERFADLDDAPTTEFLGNAGWYRYHHRRDDRGEREIHRRAYTLEEDFDCLLQEFEFNENDSSWRSLYSITIWKDADAVYAGATAEISDDFEQGEGLAGYADMRGFRSSRPDTRPMSRRRWSGRSKASTCQGPGRPSKRGGKRSSPPTSTFRSTPKPRNPTSSRTSSRRTQPSTRLQRDGGTPFSRY